MILVHKKGAVSRKGSNRGILSSTWYYFLSMYTLRSVLLLVGSGAGKIRETSELWARRLGVRACARCVRAVREVQFPGGSRCFLRMDAPCRVAVVVARGATLSSGVWRCCS